MPVGERPAVDFARRRAGQLRLQEDLSRHRGGGEQPGRMPSQLGSVGSGGSECCGDLFKPRRFG